MRKGKHSELGEVYTPDNVIVDIIKEYENGKSGITLSQLKDPKETWVEPSMGDGRLLVAIKKLLMKHGHTEENVLSRLYGVEINPESCKKAILNLYGPGELTEITKKGSSIRKWKHSIWGEIQNLVCTNSYDYNFEFTDNTKVQGFDWLQIEE